MKRKMEKKLRNYTGIGALTLAVTATGIKGCESLYSNINTSRLPEFTSIEYKFNQHKPGLGLKRIYYYFTNTNFSTYSICIGYENLVTYDPKLSVSTFKFGDLVLEKEIFAGYLHGWNVAEIKTVCITKR